MNLQTNPCIPSWTQTPVHKRSDTSALGHEPTDVVTLSGEGHEQPNPMHEIHKWHTIIDRVGVSAERMEQGLRVLRPAMVSLPHQPVAAPQVTLKAPHAAPQAFTAKPQISRLPLRSAATGDMSEMVESMRRNGYVSENSHPPLRQANTPELSAMVDNMQRNGMLPESVPAKAPVVETPKANLVSTAEQIAHKHGFIARSMHVADKFLHPLNIVLGANQAREGVESLAHAGNAKEGVKGALDVVGGTANTLSGVAGSAIALTRLTASTAVAGTTLGSITGVGAGVAMVADGVKTTIDGLEIKSGKLQVTDGYKVVGGVMKTAGGGMVIAGVLTGNPVLVVGGGVTYLGGMAVEHGREIGAWANQATHTVTQEVSNTYHTVEHGVSNLVSSMGNTFSSGFHAIFGN